MQQSWNNSEWKGSKPQRFSGGKRCDRPQDQLTSFLNQHYSLHESDKGIRTYAPCLSSEKKFIPHLKIFPESYLPLTKDVDPRGKKCVGLPQQKQRYRAEKLHVKGGRESMWEFQQKGIKTFKESNQSKSVYYNIEKQFQTKKKIYGLECQRNNLAISSLGDKSYKYPDYAPDFFKDGGLIVGSTQKLRNRPQTNFKMMPTLSKPNWNQKMKIEEAQEEKKVVNSVDDWENSILKEENPNWKDPEKFFQREEGKKEEKKGKK